MIEISQYILLVLKLLVHIHVYVHMYMYVLLALSTCICTCVMTLCVCGDICTVACSLTVEEHLLFYGQLKGLSRKEVKKQIPE